MKITNISIRNFRSIRSAEIDCANFNIFVGQNNAGKTNLFEAIEWFFNPKSFRGDLNDLRFQRKPKNNIEVSISFSGAQAGARKMKHEKNRDKILNILEDSDEVTLYCGVVILRIVWSISMERKRIPAPALIPH